MHKAVRISLSLIVIPIILLSFILVQPVSIYAAPQAVFPAEHQDLLGGGSYSALFGHNTAALSPGKTSASAKAKPPRILNEGRVNDPQQGAPNGLFGRSETSIASSEDGQFLVAGWNDADGFLRPPFGNTLPGTPGLSGFGFSSNGGATWIDGGAPPVIDHIVTRGDPWLDRGGLDNSTFFYANLGVDDRLPATQATLGVSVHRGHFTNGAFTFEDVKLLQAPNYPDDFYDKEAIATAKDGSGDGYVTLTNFIELCGQPAFGFGQIELWRTHDGGNTWQGPTIVSADKTTITDPNNPDCGNAGVLQQSSSPSIGPNGEVYVTWQIGPTFNVDGSISTDASIAVATSLDGGVTFGAPVTVANINSMRQNAPVGYNRATINDHPRIAVATSGSKKGRIYVVYANVVAPTGASSVVTCPAGVVGTCVGQNLTSSQVFVTFSDNKGSTWSTPTPLAPAVPATGVKRLWPTVAIEPGGDVSVAFYESQEAPTAANPTCVAPLGGNLFRVGAANSLVNTILSLSTDGTNFTTTVKVSSATTNWCTTVSNIRPNFGDYIGNSSGGNRSFPTWADGRNGVPDVFFAVVKGGK